MVSDDGTTGRDAELIPFECGNSRSVEEVSRVERAVADKLVTRTMERVRAGPGNRIHDAARAASVVSARVAGSNGESLNGIDAKHHAKNASQRALGIVV